MSRSCGEIGLNGDPCTASPTARLDRAIRPGTLADFRVARPTGGSQPPERAPWRRIMRAIPLRWMQRCTLVID
jgi:hypothetical protein